MTPSAFITSWNGTERAERANYISFLNELCAILNLPPPPPSSRGQGAYRYERAVTHHAPDGTPTTRRIDLKKRGCFVLEAKRSGPGATMVLRGPPCFHPSVELLSA
jgi:hypothetical protein